jgi:hypothetical protein
MIALGHDGYFQSLPLISHFGHQYLSKDTTTLIKYALEAPPGLPRIEMLSNLTAYKNQVFNPLFALEDRVFRKK